MVARWAGAVSRAARGRAVRDPRAGRDARANRGGGPGSPLRRKLAAAIADASWLDESDLAEHRSEWVEPLRYDYRGVEVCELPPNGQGAAALVALALYDGLPPGLHSQVEAMKLALADAYAHIADAPLPPSLLDPGRLASRRQLVEPGSALLPQPSRLPHGGTTYLCAVDADGTAISLIQSLYGPFGSGVLAPGTGVVLQNRAAGFVEDEDHPNRLAPGRRPFHTIIPGMLLEGGSLLGPFGVMGGPMQPQGHMQVVLRLVDHGDDPQAALDAPRWRVGEGREVQLEPGLWNAEPDLTRLGHEVTRGAVMHEFGVGQAILRLGGALIGGSDGRGDGYATGY